MWGLRAVKTWRLTLTLYMERQVSDPLADDNWESNVQKIDCHFRTLVFKAELKSTSSSLAECCFFQVGHSVVNRYDNDILS